MCTYCRLQCLIQSVIQMSNNCRESCFLLANLCFDLQDGMCSGPIWSPRWHMLDTTHTIALVCLSIEAHGSVSVPGEHMAEYHFDLVFARRADGPAPRFLRLIEHEAQQRGLRFFHCQHHDHAEALCAAIEAGDVGVSLLIDYMGRSFGNDEELCTAVQRCGGIVIDDPAMVRRYGNKLAMHTALAEAGVMLPRTIIWPEGQACRGLSENEREWLGVPFVAKPSYGSGSCGVVLDMDGSYQSVERAAGAEADDDYLLQEFVHPLELDGRLAWFRVYNCFGRVFACFWNPYTHATTLVMPEEVTAYRLYELARISNTISHITGYTWFSTEIALAERDGQRVFLPIDYLNNKCFMLTQSEVGPIGMPDRLAELVAAEFVEQAAQHRDAMLASR